MAEQDCNNRINLPFTLSSSTPSWGDFHHHATRPSTSLMNKTVASVVNLWENHNNSNSSPCDQEDISITASGHSSLTFDESSHRFIEPSSSFNNIIREPAATSNSQYLWTQLLSGVGEGQEMPDKMNDEVGENLLNALSLKSFSGGMLEPSACSDYLKKLDTCHHNEWVDNNGDHHFPNSNTNSSFTNHYNKLSFNNNVGYFGDSTMIESDEHRGSLIKYSSSNPVNSCSIAPPPDQSQIHHLDPHPCNNIPSIDQNLEYQQKLFEMGHSVENSSFDGACYDSFNHTQPVNYHREEIDRDGSSQTTLFPKSYINNSEYGHRSVEGNWRPRESSMHFQNGFIPSVNDPFSNSSSLLSSKPLLKSLSLLDSRKLHQGHLSKPLINKSNGSRGQGASDEAKKKKSDDNSQSSGSLKKKPKHENGSSNPSNASSSTKTTNSQTPKVKIAAEKISALQQIVSPYGKTDTASVLQESIGFIKCLQEQVQLLSNPYLKSSVNKLQAAWGSLDKRFDKGDQKNKEFDLKSKGLCLVPTSCIPPVFKDDSGPDYWPTYRGCLYR